MISMLTIPELTSAIRAQLDTLDALFSQYRTQLGHATPIDQVIEVSSDVFQVPRAHILSRSRLAEYVQARHAVWYALRGMGWPIPDIAGQFNVHRGSIHSALASVANRAKQDPGFKHRLDAVLRRCAVKTPEFDHDGRP